MNPAGVSTLRDLAGLYGDVVIGTLVFAVAILFVLLTKAQRDHLKDARAFGEAAAKLGNTVEANTQTMRSAVATLDEASDTLRLAYELTGRRRRKRDIDGTPTPATGTGT